MTKEQFDQLYTLAEQAMQEIRPTYVCGSCNAPALVGSSGVNKSCECEAAIIANMGAVIEGKASLTN